MGNTPLEPILFAKIIGTGGGSDANAVHYTADAGKTDAEKAQARANIDAISIDDIGTVFTLKGSVATVADLDNISDPQIGDVWYVDAVSAGYIWMTSTDYPNGYWEELGETIDLSAYQLKPTIVSDSVSTSITIASAEDNTIYKYGTLSALTVTDMTNGEFIIKFTSGSTATNTNFPASMKFPDDYSPFAADANTRYEISVSEGYAAVGKWSTT